MVLIFDKNNYSCNVDVFFFFWCENLMNILFNILLKKKKLKKKKKHSTHSLFHSKHVSSLPNTKKPSIT